MDPNAALRLAVNANTARERLQALEDLDQWIRGGGLAPHWAMELEGTKRYVKRYGWRPSMPESFRGGPVMSRPIVTFRIHHSITETDFGDYHSWSSSALTTAHNDEATIRRMTEEVSAKLRAKGCEVHIEETSHRNPFPSGW